MIETQSHAKTTHAEQAELEAVLASEAFRRAPTLARILEYLCERQFCGATSIKEHEIATQVMGRTSDFDPQQDGSVRVNLHHLRKKLKSFYEVEGSTHAIRISLPTGQSLPSFISQPTKAEQGWPPNGGSAKPGFRPPVFSGTESTPEFAASVPATQDQPSAETEIGTQVRPVKPRRPAGLATLVALACAVALATSLLIWFITRPRASESTPAAVSNATLRIACGRGQRLEDTAGRFWDADADYHGGSAFHRSIPAIAGASDAGVYQNGREGSFSYDLPVPRGVYEVHLYFAETALHGEGFRTMAVWINGRQVEQMLDVTSDAGGFATATERIYLGVRPGPDGKIRVQFKGISAGAFVNAIEIMPGNGEAMRPIRQTTLPTYLIDPQGTTWRPDAWFHGGRVSHLSLMFPGLPLQGIYQNERFGNFSYSIPVAPSHTYSLTLYFQDVWFSHQPKPIHESGVRRFDVICNGQVLLRQFDVLEEAGHEQAPGTSGGFRVTRHFSGIEPTPSGKINLTFSPSKNYAQLNALTIEEEPVQPVLK